MMCGNNIYIKLDMAYQYKGPNKVGASVNQYNGGVVQFQFFGEYGNHYELGKESNYPTERVESGEVK